MKLRIVLIRGGEGERDPDLLGPAKSNVVEEERQPAMPSWLSLKKPAEGWHVAFAQGCGGLGPGGEGRAHRICDLASAECLSGRPRGLLHNRRHVDELEVPEKDADEVVVDTAAIGAPKSRIRLPTAEPPPAISSCVPSTIGRGGG